MLRSTDASAFGRGMVKGRALVLGGNRGHSARLCCNRSLTGHSVGNRRAKHSLVSQGECSGVNPRGPAILHICQTNSDLVLQAADICIWT